MAAAKGRNKVSTRPQKSGPNDRKRPPKHTPRELYYRIFNARTLLIIWWVFLCIGLIASWSYQHWIDDINDLGYSAQDTLDTIQGKGPFAVLFDFILDKINNLFDTTTGTGTYNTGQDFF